MAFTAGTSPKFARSIRISTALGVVVTIGALFACSANAALAETTSPSCNLYASTSGSDSNAGTAAAPFATAKHLLEELSAGQTGCLASGQTFASFTLYEGNTHGAAGQPVTLTSTNPEQPATISGRVVTEKGTNWLNFTHLDFVYGADTLYAAIGIGSAHTSWTYDDVSGSDLNICFLTNPVGSSFGAGEYALIEHDRVHNCGHPVTKAELEAQASDTYEGRENGWHTHGLYNEGLGTTVKNSYFYDSSGIGILLRGGSGAVIEHNVIDSNGRGVELGDESPEHDTVAWNIISNSTSPCGTEEASGSHCDTYGVLAFGSVGAGNVVRDNDVYGNEAGNIEPGLAGAIGLEANVEANPLYANAATHQYAMQAGTPAAGYGPDSAQPTLSTPVGTETPLVPPPPAGEKGSKPTPPASETQSPPTPPATGKKTPSAPTRPGGSQRHSRPPGIWAGRGATAASPRARRKHKRHARPAKHHRHARSAKHSKNHRKGRKARV